MSAHAESDSFGGGLSAAEMPLRHFFDGGRSADASPAFHAPRGDSLRSGGERRSRDRLRRFVFFATVVLGGQLFQHLADQAIDDRLDLARKMRQLLRDTRGDA